jgi:hypothetical protein
LANSWRKHGLLNPLERCLHVVFAPFQLRVWWWPHPGRHRNDCMNQIISLTWSELFAVFWMKSCLTNSPCGWLSLVWGHFKSKQIEGYNKPNDSESIFGWIKVFHKQLMELSELRVWLRRENSLCSHIIEKVLMLRFGKIKILQVPWPTLLFCQDSLCAGLYKKAYTNHSYILVKSQLVRQPKSKLL